MGECVEYTIIVAVIGRGTLDADRLTEVAIILTELAGDDVWRTVLVVVARKNFEVALPVIANIEPVELQKSFGKLRQQ